MRKMHSKEVLPDLSAEGHISSILIIKYRALGDIVLSFPFLSVLREAFPQAKISFVCMENFAEALLDNPSIDELVLFKDDILSEIKILLEQSLKRYDLVLDLVSSPFSAYLTFLTGARMRIGFDVGRQRFCYSHLLPRVFMEDGLRKRIYTFDSNLKLLELMNINVEQNWKTDSFGKQKPGRDRFAIGFPAALRETEWAENYLKEVNPLGLRMVGIVPGAKYQSKAWPIERFAELAKRLIEVSDVCPIVLWGPGEKEIAESIVRRVPGAVLSPEIGISKLGALISRLDLLIGVDSGPKHIAVLLGIPTLTLFGPTDPHIWDPMTENHRVVYRDLPCSPCSGRSCNPNLCLLDIEVDEVLAEALEILAGSPEEKGR